MCLLCCFTHLFWIYFIALLFYVLLCTLTIYSIKYCTVHSKHSFIGSLFWLHFILNLQYWKQKTPKRSVIICNERGSVLKAPDPSLCLIHLQSLPTFLINAPKLSFKRMKSALSKSRMSQASNWRTKLWKWASSCFSTRGMQQSLLRFPEKKLNKKH